MFSTTNSSAPSVFRINFIFQSFSQETEPWKNVCTWLQLVYVPQMHVNLIDVYSFRANQVASSLSWLSTLVLKSLWNVTKIKLSIDINAALHCHKLKRCSKGMFQATVSYKINKTNIQMTLQKSKQWYFSIIIKTSLTSPFACDMA